MAFSVTEWVTTCLDIILSVSALQSSFKLFKDHRAPSVGFFLLGLSVLLSIFGSPLHREAEWAGEVLAPALVSFDFLWLSRDHNTALLLCGSCLLLGLSDRLSAETLAVLTRCLGLLSLSCCLIACLFAGNAWGAVGGVALSLPVLLGQGGETNAFAPLVSPGAAGAVKWLLKGSLSIGCWVLTRALHKFLQDVTD